MSDTDPAVIHVLSEQAICLAVDHDGVHVQGILFFDNSITLGYFANEKMNVVIQDGGPIVIDLPEKYTKRLQSIAHDPEQEIENDIIDEVVKFIVVKCKMSGHKIGVDQDEK